MRSISLSMRHLQTRALITAILAFTLLAGTAMGAEDPQGKTPGMSFGLGALVGTYRVTGSKDDGPGVIESSTAIGGGLIFEAMISRHFGVHSGLWYKNIDFEYEGDITANIKELSIPIMLLVSADWWRMSFGLLAGFNLTHYLSATFVFFGNKMETLNYIENPQIAAAAGTQIKFAMGRFTDIFISVIGERCITQFIKGSGSPSYLYGAVIQSGVMFRTF